MPLILSNALLLVLVLSDLIYQARFPSGTPGHFSTGTSLSRPLVGYLLVLFPVLRHCGRWLSVWGRNFRYVYILKLIFSFPIGFTLS